ncbi:vesicle-associated protein 1-3-like isoform X2 [Camellia sinensis]|uniref:vesicle-associated protein 1-3-like isoform X2 n=1 Tax=Camellia sinensis TaxID=4442 RepID=UPI001035F1BB|nr:vesicle-associated protein 1-3-like isoform X2 [Camellia sinensis]
MDQQPQSIIKKPSKFSRFLRSIFGSCGGKSVEKTLVEDEKDGNRDYSFSFSSSGSDSDSAYSSKEKGSKNGKLQNKFQKVTDDIKEELQVADLKRKLAETTEELLEIHPRELKFIFELKKQSTCSVRLFNKSNNHVAFKVKATSPKKYSVRPNRAIIKPKSTCEFTVKMQAQRVAPPDMICKDQFLVQSTVVPAGTSDDDITPSIFAKDDVRYVEENKLKVVLVSPPNSPVLSPINRTLKPVPAYEPSILKDQVLRKDESLTQRHTVTEDVESKVENSEEANSAKNLEYKTRKDADEPLMDVGYKTRKEEDEPTTEVEHETRMDVDEPITDVEHKTMNDMEELKLVKDVSEMKSKLNGLESKLSEDENACQLRIKWNGQ